MSNGADTTLEVPSVACAVCREAIRPGARVCIHCDNYQDWRRYIGFSSTTLALVVALVSVLSVSFKSLIDLLPKSKEHIVVGMLDTNAENLQAFAYNDGETYGILQPSAVLTVLLTDGSRTQTTVSINPGVDRNMTSLIVRPGDVDAYFITYASSDRPIAKGGALVMGCELEFVVKGPHDHQRRQSFGFPCKP